MTKKIRLSLSAMLFACFSVQVTAQIPFGACATAGPTQSGRSFLLNQRIGPVNGNCLVIDANNVTIDLNGFGIRGTGAGTGIRVQPGRTGVVIKNGTITNFDRGIFGQQASVRVTNVSVNSTGTNTIDNGIELGFGSQVINSRVTGGGSGILVAGNALIASNVVRRSGNGIVCGGSSTAPVGGCFVRDNQTEGADTDGILVFGAGGVIRGNTVVGSGDEGIAILGFGNLVQGNSVQQSGSIGLFANIGSNVRDNVVIASGDEGMIIECPSLVESNAVNDSGVTAPGTPNLRLNGAGCLRPNNLAP
ncbi:MAG: NosD domain-containing protein [Pseudomonadota bacterium]